MINQRGRHLFSSGNWLPCNHTRYWPQYWMSHLKSFYFVLDQFLKIFCVWPCQNLCCSHQKMLRWSCGQGLFGIGWCFAYHLECPPPEIRPLFHNFCHLALWHPPPPWRAAGQVEVVGGGVLLLPVRHVVIEELLLHRLLAGQIGDQLSWQKFPPGKESLSASCNPRLGHIHLHPKVKIIPENAKKENTCFLSCGSMEPSLPHSSSPPFVETSFKPSLQIFPTHKLHIQCGLTCISPPPIRPLLDGRSSHQSTLPSDQSSGQGKEIEPANKENYKNWWITDAEIICQCWSYWYPPLLLNSYQSQFHQCYLPFILKSSFHNSSSEILTHEVLIKCCWILVVGIWNKSGIKLAHKCCSSSHTLLWN